MTFSRRLTWAGGPGWYGARLWRWLQNAYTLRFNPWHRRFGQVFNGDLSQRPKSDPAKLAMAARLRRETTRMLPWIAARLQAGSWKSLAAKRHRWRKNHASPDNESRL